MLVEEALQALKSAFDADGARMEIGAIDQNTISINLHVNKNTCRECLLPVPELELLIREALLDKGIDSHEIRVQFMEDDLIENSWKSNWFRSES